MLKKIVIKGAKEHNLKNISLEIPKDKFIDYRISRIEHLIQTNEVKNNGS